MEHQLRRTLATTLGALALAGCNGAAPGPDQQAVRHYGELAFTPCTLTAPYLTTNVEAQCTTYEVAEDPARPEGRKVALNIAWLPGMIPVGYHRAQVERPGCRRFPGG